jgi:hypothetical protein
VSTFLLLCFVAAQAPSATPPAGPAAAAAGARVALVFSPAVQDDAAARAALQAHGYVVEPHDATTSLVSEAQQAGGACAVDDAECWAKVGLYAGFERIVVVEGPSSSTTASASPPIRVLMIDVATGKKTSEGRGDDVTRAIEALLTPAAAPSSSEPAMPDAPVRGALASDGAPGISMMGAATIGAATVATLALVSGVAFEVIAVDHLNKLRTGAFDGAVKDQVQRAIDAERLEIASFAVAGVAGVGAAVAGFMWWSE